MTDLETIVQQELDRAGEPALTMDDLRRRRDRRLRGRRLGIAVFVLVLAAGVIGGTAVIFNRGVGPVPMRPNPRPTGSPHVTVPKPVSPMPLPPLMSNGPITIAGLLSGGLRESGPDGSRAHVLMKCHGSCTMVDDVAWSRDGTRVAFVTACGGGCGSAGDPYHGIRVYDVRRRTDRRIAAGDTYSALAWSPDGTRIVYAIRPAEGLTANPAFFPQVPGGAIYVMNADGTSPQQLVGHAGWIVSLSWSPDGTSLLYSDTTHEMYLLRLGGFAPLSLGTGWGPAWSPDGTRFAYSDAACVISIGQIGGQRRVIATLSPPRTDCRAIQDPGPTWSPDGTQLVFILDGRVWIMGADGSDPHLIHLGENAWDSVAWRPVS